MFLSLIELKHKGAFYRYGFSLLFNIFAEKKTYYAGIMLDALSIVLCSKLCQHNVSDPNHYKAEMAILSTNQISEISRLTLLTLTYDNY